MKFADFKRLKAMMARSTSENDPECLASIRAANRVLAANGLTWDRVLDRSVRVIQDVEEGPSDASAEADTRSSVEYAFQTIYGSADMSDSFKDFIDSLRAQWERKGSLSPAQLSALMKAAQRTAEGNGSR